MANEYGWEISDWLGKYENFLKRKKKKVALDIGAANGANSFYLASLGFKVDAVDIKPPDPDNVEKIKTKYPELKFDPRNVDFIQSDIMDFDFGGRKYDVITAYFSLHYLNDAHNGGKDKLDDLLGKIKGALKPDGIVFIKDFLKRSKNSPNYHFEQGELRLKMKRLGMNIAVDHEETLWDPGHGETVSPHKHVVATVVARNDKAEDR